MIYPIAIHKDSGTAYGVAVPDLPGCFSVGDSLEEAIRMGTEAIELHLEGIMADGEQFPIPSPIAELKTKREWRGAVWALVEINPIKLSGAVRRINITLPERVLRRIDATATRLGESRSGIIARLAMEGASLQ